MSASDDARCTSKPPATVRRSCCCTAGRCTADCSRRSCRRSTPRYRVHVVDLPGHGSVGADGDAAISRRIVATIDAATAAIGEPVVVARLVARRTGRAAVGARAARPRRAAGARRDDAVVRRARRLAARDGGARRSRASATSSRVAYRLTLQRFLTLQMQGSERWPRARWRSCAASLFARGEPSPAGARGRARRCWRRPICAPTLARSRGARARRRRRARHAGAARGDGALARGGAAGRDATRRSPAPRTRRSCRIRRRFSTALDAFVDAAEPRFPAPDPRDVDPRAVRRAFARAAATYDAAAVLQREVGARMAQRLDYVKIAPTRRSSTRAAAPARRSASSASRYPGATVVAFDLALPMVEAARRRAHAQPLAAAPAAAAAARREARRAPRFVCADINALPFAGVSRRPRLEQPRAAVGERPAARVRRVPPRAEGRRAAVVHDVRPRHAAGDARRVRARRRRTRTPTASSTCTTSATCSSHAGFADPVMDMEHVTLTYADRRARCCAS